MAKSSLCIYCGRAFAPGQGEGDHVIPSQLGEFRRDTRFRGACPDCNSRIGQIEQQIVQSGPESFFRQIVKPNSQRLNKRGMGRPRGAKGAPPPEHLINMGDHHALVEPTDNPQDVIPVDHVFVRDDQGDETHIRLYPGMRTEQFREKLARAGLSTMAEARLHCGDAHWLEFTNLLREVWPNAKLEEGEPMSPGLHPEQRGAVKFTVNSHYFRAIAKIGFHYLLAHSRRGFRGDEECFSGIREFIYKAGDTDRFFDDSAHAPFVLPFGRLPNGDVATPHRWCHVIGASEANGEAEAYVQLFLGPGSLPTPHYLRIGQWTSSIITPNNVWGHIYMYDEPQQHGRYAGWVTPAQVSKIQKIRYPS